MAMNPKALISKLNETCRSALLAASQYAKRNTHYEVDIEHLVFRLCQSSDTDVAHICRYFAIDPDGVAKDLIAVLDRVQRGNSRSEYPTSRLAYWNSSRKLGIWHRLNSMTTRFALGTFSSLCSRQRIFRDTSSGAVPGSATFRWKYYVRNS
jgi:ATP-dependent Clp protease ATP-binding subunit ClpA